MRCADTWQDYELIDATGHNRLERWGKTLLIRPDPQIIWKNEPVSPLWNRVDAVAEKKSVLWSSQSSSFSLPGRVTCCRKICKNSSRSVMLTAPYLPGCP